MRDTPRAWCGVVAAALLVTAGCGSRSISLLPPKPADVARDAFNLHDADLRRRSVTRLANAPFGGEGPYVRMYRMLLDDPDPTVRAAAIKALAAHGEPADAEAIAARLEDPAAFTRWQAARALQRLHHPPTADALAGALARDEDADVRMAAARALGQYPQPKVFQALVAALDDRDFAVARAARGALRTLTGRDLGLDARAWVAWSKENPEALFEGQRPYGWRPYAESPGVLEKAQFWRDGRRDRPRPPKGMTPPSG